MRAGTVDQLRTPAVVRLTKARVPTQNKVRFSRINVFLRDGFRCQYCARSGRRASSTMITYAACSRRYDDLGEHRDVSYACNDRKGSRTPAEAGMKLLRQPSTPKSLPFPPVIRPGTSVPEVWRDYCALGG